MVEPTSRRAREQAQQRATVLSAAAEVFSRKGFQGATMAEIAERAEFAVGTLYNLFNDKRDIYDALVRDTVSAFVGRLLTALNEPADSLTRLERFIDAETELYVEHAPLARLYFAETAGSWVDPTVGLDAEVRAMCTAVRTRTAEVIREAMDAGQMRNADPVVLAIALEGIGQAFFRAMLETPDDLPADRVAHAIKLVFFEQLRTTP